jgi:hypothetical protein
VEKLPIIRKVISVGAAKGITLPISWFRYNEEKLGHTITMVIIEINKEIKVLPYIPSKER